MSETKQNFETWAVVELMGHVRMAGRVTEEEHFGGKMGRIDIPKTDKCETCRGKGWEAGGVGPLGQVEELQCKQCNGCGTVGFFTQWFTSASVYRMTACTEEAARAVEARNQPEPVHSWELPKPALVAKADRTMKCGHTPENCVCDPIDDDQEEEGPKCSTCGVPVYDCQCEED